TAAPLIILVSLHDALPIFVGEKQRRRRRVFSKNARRIHERDVMLRRKGRQLLERPIVQMHGMTDGVLITNWRDRRGVGRYLPRRSGEHTSELPSLTQLLIR